MSEDDKRIDWKEEAEKAWNGAGWKEAAERRTPLKYHTNKKAEPGFLAQILDDVNAFLELFVICQSKEAHDAHVFWIAHTLVMDPWEPTPPIAFLSPDPASGKTRALE